MTSQTEFHNTLPAAVQAFLRRLPELSAEAWVQVRAARSGRGDMRRRLGRTQREARDEPASRLARQWLDRGIANGLLPDDPEARAAMDGAIGALLDDPDPRTALRLTAYGPFQSVVPISSLDAYCVTPEELAEVYGPARALAPTLELVASPTVSGTLRGGALGLAVFAAATVMDFPVGQLVGGLIVAGFGYRWLVRGHLLAPLRWFGG